MDFEQISRSLLPLLGGKENIASAAHCATRLRLVLVDDALADQQAIGKIEGVKGCFRNAGQMQIIFGLSDGAPGGGRTTKRSRTRSPRWPINPPLS